MGTPLENEENSPLKEIHNSILRIHKKIDYIFSLFILASLFENFINKLNLTTIIFTLYCGFFFSSFNLKNEVLNKSWQRYL